SVENRIRELTNQNQHNSNEFTLYKVDFKQANMVLANELKTINEN
ncbi:4409_t:CDS:1, partial [Entrophospora sp. SA101]